MTDWIEWPVEGWPGLVRYHPQALGRISDLMVAGYRISSWGGVELGGILLGSTEDSSFIINGFIPVECEHAYGPSYLLTDEDRAAMRKEIDAARAQGLEPVGCYKSVSSREVSITTGDLSVWAEFFPAGVFLILKRSKEGVTGGATFCRAEGKIFTGRRSLEAQEFALSESESSRPAEPPVTQAAPPAAPAGPSLPKAASALRAVPTSASASAPVQQKAATAPILGASQPPSEASASGIGGKSIQDLLQNARRAARRSEPPPEPAPLLPFEPSPPAAPPATKPPATAAAAAGPAVSQPALRARVDAFALTPDPEFFYPSPQHCEALANLEYSIKSHKGFVMLVGDSGTGKTMVLECLSDRLKAEEIEYGYVFSSRFTAGEFFELLTVDFGLKPFSNTKTSILMALNQHLLERANLGQATALLIDDAQKLTTEVLEEIELLSNLETRKRKLLQVIMAARPDFESQLNRPEHAGLRQRIILRPRLGPLSSTETADYIRVRLDRAGKAGLASALPAPEIHRLSKGIPRVISAICGQLLERRGRNDHIPAGALKEVAKALGLT